jgi:transposase InsO family protein
MAYTKNPFLPRVRMEAVNLVRLQGWGVREAARHLGVSPGTVSKWIHKAPHDGRFGIPTLSSAPHRHPNAISREIEAMIVAERKKHGRCGDVIFETLKLRGLQVSRPSVHRTLERHGLTKKWSKWKKRHASPPRPQALIPGDLIEIDTIHAVPAWGTRFYVYTLIDVASRWAYAVAAKKLSSGASLLLVSQARQRAVFPFQTIQSDHGPEFSSWFTSHLEIPHRHIRIGKPNDNAHIERFNRSIQDECLKKLPMRIEDYARALPKYIRYYNMERMHMGIGYRTPDQKVAELFPRS